MGYNNPAPRGVKSVADQKMKEMSQPTHVSCPTCQRKGPWKELSTNPFCSDRCKMVDLGKWLGEEYRIASPLTGEDLLELDDLSEEELKDL